ncbi:MAG: hypothetical protein AAGF56_05890 [Pseudomonadota bacterium]
MKGDPNDAKGLIREAFRIEGITAGECRSIFLDWALSLPPGQDPQKAVAALLTRYRPTVSAKHPMIAVLEEARDHAPVARRRGGRRGRVV